MADGKCSRWPDSRRTTLLLLTLRTCASLPTDSATVGLTKKDLDQAEAIADLLASEASAQDRTNDRRKWRHWGPDIADLKESADERVKPYSIAVRNMLRQRAEWEKKAVLTNSGRYLQSQAQAARAPVTVRTHVFVTRDNKDEIPRNRRLQEGHFVARRAQAGKPDEMVPLPHKAAGAWARRSGFLRVAPMNTRTGLTPTLPMLV